MKQFMENDESELSARVRAAVQRMRAAATVAEVPVVEATPPVAQSVPTPKEESRDPQRHAALYQGRNDLPVKRLRECKRLLVEGNTVLVTWYATILKRKGLADVRPRDRHYNRNDFRMELFALIDAGKKEWDNGKRGQQREVWLRLTRTGVAAINAVRGIQQELIDGFAWLIDQQARKWANRSNGYPDFWEYQAEAVIAAIDAIYGFTKPRKQIRGYLSHVIQRRLANAMYCAHPTGRRTSTHRKLKRQARMEAKKINGPHNTVDLIERLGLKDRHLAALEKALSRVVFVSVTGSGDQLEGDHANDYTAMSLHTHRTPLQVMLDTPAEETQIGDGDDDCDQRAQLALLESLELTAFQRDVLQAAMTDGSRGWQTRVCKRWKYTRRAAGVAIARIREKLQQAAHGKAAKVA